ncbi:hypothetical protein MD535_24730 [Vibrio sp. ZSDZ65]|uniref:Adhesin n=1 Tax=Vibrio qingdaonensis TaxID=2829491 RepID=A0A9X3CT08_9VIBR|nr:hypothetical protein [Vibrio qingdaonensis]MCW8349196.1 hypothetical protein [Vibrio qingdaonensis]
MMNRIWIGLCLSIPLVVQAEDVPFSGDVSSYCTVNVSSPGTLSVSGTSISTQTDAVVSVQNNEANAYELNIVAPTGFSSTPAGYSGIGTFSQAVFDSSGANIATDVTKLTLTNLGDDTVSVTVGGTSDTVMIAGTYQAVAVLSCDAL